MSRFEVLLLAIPLESVIVGGEVVDSFEIG